MKKDNLLKRVSQLGFSLFEVEEEQNVNQTLADMVKSKELRLWEGFPVVLATSTENGLFDYNAVRKQLKDPDDRLHLQELMLMSLALYQFFQKSLPWVENYHSSLSDKNKKKLTNFCEKLKHNTELSLAGHTLSAQRLKTAFGNYLSQSEMSLHELLSLKDELALEYALSQVFSPKQKELFLKKLKREKLTKTEKEYFSRAVKRKALALANPELHRLSQRLLQE